MNKRNRAYDHETENKLDTVLEKAENKIIQRTTNNMTNKPMYNL